jgi:uncharacterized protein (TIRG00374 family)
MSVPDAVADEAAVEPRAATVSGVAPDAEVSARSMSLGRRLRSPQTLISFAVAFALIFLIFRRLDINFSQVWGNVRASNPWLLALGFAAYYASFPIRAARWTRLLANAEIDREHGYDVPNLLGMSEIYILSWFANCIAPAKLGDAYRGYVFKKCSGASFTKTLGTIFAERLLDVVALAVLLIASGLLAFHGNVPDSLRWWYAAGIALAVIGVMGVIALAAFGNRIGRLMPARVRPYYERLQQGLVMSFKRGHTTGIVVTTVAIWLLEGVRVWAVATALGVDLAAAGSLFVALLASLLTTFPITPAGLGAVESGTILALKLFDASADKAASVALVDRAIAYWSVILIGGTLYLFSKRK